jgi:hypothetical protein
MKNIGEYSHNMDLFYTLRLSNLARLCQGQGIVHIHRATSARVMGITILVGVDLCNVY